MAPPKTAAVANRARTKTTLNDNHTEKEGAAPLN